MFCINFILSVDLMNAQAHRLLEFPLIPHGEAETETETKSLFVETMLWIPGMHFIQIQIGLKSK